MQAPTPQPAASNTTTQTITQVQAAPCTSHCDGGVQIQEASQDNTTVQVVDPGPAATAGGGPTAAPPQTTTAPSPTGGATQVQVGCMQYCYGATTLDTSGLTLAQIEQLLGALVLPGLPPLTLVPGTVQNVTQQASDQSQTGDGPTVDPSQTVGAGQTAGSSPTGDGGTAGQAQVAAQFNTTVQVVAGATGAGVGPAAVNQTAQGIWQVQIGCLFDCAGTQQLQQATQSNTTVQAVGGSGAADATVPSAVDTVIRIVWQLQIGCLFWCYDAVEGQTATGTDATVLVTPGPAPGPSSSPSRRHREATRLPRSRWPGTHRPMLRRWRPAPRLLPIQRHRRLRLRPRARAPWAAPACWGRRSGSLSRAASIRFSAGPR